MYLKGKKKKKKPKVYATEMPGGKTWSYCSWSFYLLPRSHGTWQSRKGAWGRGAGARKHLSHKKYFAHVKG
jgi:hypothetical protein